MASTRRDAAYPDVPTAAEAGGPESFTLDNRTALFAPKGTPAATLTRIRDDVAQVLTDPDMRQRLAALSYDPLTLSPAAFGERLQRDGERFGEAVRRLNISLD